MFSLFKNKEREWPFDQPKNCAVFTLKQIMNNELPILVVYHDLEDDGWQFVSNIELSAEDAMMVTLESVAKLDPSVLEVANLEPGYHAWRRNASAQWTIALKHLKNKTGLTRQRTPTHYTLSSLDL